MRCSRIILGLLSSLILTVALLSAVATSVYAVGQSSDISAVLSGGSSSGQIGLEVISVDSSQVHSHGLVRVTLRYRGTDAVSVYINGRVYSVNLVNKHLQWRELTLEVKLPPNVVNPVIETIASSKSGVESAVVRFTVATSGVEESSSVVTSGAAVRLPSVTSAQITTDAIISADEDTNKIPTSTGSNDTTTSQTTTNHQPHTTTGWFGLDDLTWRYIWLAIIGIVFVFLSWLLLIARRRRSKHDRAT